jgi:hypothetical protein
MPQAVQSLPYVAWILLAALAFGSFAFVVITHHLTDATRGYLRFTSIVATVLVLLAWLVDGGLTSSQSLVVRQASSDLVALRWAGLMCFILVALLFAAAVSRTRASRVLGAVGILTALVTLGVTAFGWVPSPPDAVPFLVQLVVLSLATGGSLAAIILGHWYLVTPKISERPIVLQARLLLGVIGLQVLLFVVWTTLGGGPGQDAFEAYSGGSLLLVVLRLVVTLLFPLVLTWMAWRTALTRSMESATGLLYINLAAVMAGTIGAAALYVSSGLLL